MPETPITLTVDADELSPQSLGEVLRAFMGLLAEVDAELSDNAQPTLSWRLTALSYNTPLTVSMVGSPRRGHRDNGPTVVRRCIRASRVLVNGDRPAEFNDDALRHIRRLVTVSGDIQGVRVSSEIVQENARMTRSEATTIDRVLPFGYSIGSIEGRLESINIHGTPQFTVYDAVTGRPVRCYFSESDLARVSIAIGRKVTVSGRLRRDPEGRPQQMRPVEVFGVIDEPPAIALRDAAGMFGEMDDPEHYMERIRGR